MAPTPIAYALLGAVLVASAVSAGPLEDYVKAADPTFKWSIAEQYQSPVADAMVYVLNVTSQTWQPPGEDPFVLWHMLPVVVPRGVTNASLTHATFYLTGRNTDNPQIPRDQRDLVTMTHVAVASKTIAGVMYHVPNQPTTFKTDPLRLPLKEDGIIAHGWRMFVERPNHPKRALWLARLPMTKAAVRGMDALTQLAVSHLGVSAEVASNLKFVVGGASKRGWTSWTTAAVDPRVVGAFPMVMPMAKLKEQLHRHWTAYGGWSFAFFDYWREGLTRIIDTPIFHELLSIEDPYSYFHQLRARKVAMNVISTTNDEFFLPDEPNVWYDELHADNEHNVHLRLWPNCGHGVISQCGDSVGPQIAAFVRSLKGGDEKQRPSLKWEVFADEKAQTTHLALMGCSRVPEKLTLWRAETPAEGGRRDFRQNVGFPPQRRPVAWTSEDLPFTADCRAFVEITHPEETWNAAFVEYSYPGGETWTTSLVVAPDTFPFPDCTGAECGGTLV